MGAQARLKYGFKPYATSKLDVAVSLVLSWKLEVVTLNDIVVFGLLRTTTL